MRAVQTNRKRRPTVDTLERRLLLTGTITSSVGTTNLVGIEGYPVSGVVATFKDSSSSALAHLNASIAWGDGSSSAGAVSFNSTTGNYQVAGTHTYRFDSTYHPVASIVDSAGGSASPVASIYIADAPFHPFGTTITVAAGHSFSGVVGSFIDSDPNATLSYYTASITWGDGHVSKGTVAFNSVTHRNDISGTNTYAAAATYPLNVYVKEIGGMNVTIKSSAIVTGTVPVQPKLTPFPVTITGVEGARFNGVVGSFTDSTTASNYTTTITWGDGHTSSGTIALNTTTHRFDVSGSNTYAEEGSYALAVRITSTGGLSTTINSSAHIADAPLTASAVSFAGKEGQQFSGAVALFADANPNASGSNFSATINWGDGTSATAGVISFNAGAGKWQVSGTHTYRVGGTYHLTVNIHDVGGSNATASPTGTIAGAAISAAGVSKTYIQDVMKVTPQLVATFISGNPLALASDFNVAIDWGDTTTNNPTSTITVVYDSTNRVFDVMATHPYSQIGVTYTLKITITEGNSASSTTATSLIRIL